MFSPLFKVLEERNSAINGRIRVIRSLGLGIYIQVENLTQSGGVVYNVWKTTLRKIKRKKDEVEDCLILGLGGGSAASLVKNYWPKAKITGVDIDPVMIELGKKYLGLTKVKVVIEDAEGFVRKDKKKFDLILIDTYTGDEFPKEFEKEEFLKQIKKKLKKEGMAIFNRLYYGEKRKEAMRFGESLEKVFSKVERVFPEANILFIVS